MKLPEKYKTQVVELKDLQEGDVIELTADHWRTLGYNRAYFTHGIVCQRTEPTPELGKFYPAGILTVGPVKVEDLKGKVGMYSMHQPTLTPFKKLTGLTAGKLKAERLKLIHEDFVTYFGHRRGFTVGADPEMFYEDGTGKMVPAFDFLPKKGMGMPFYDGFQGEWTTKAGETCCDRLTRQVGEGMASSLYALRSKYPKGKILPKTTVNIEEIEKYSDEQVQFGCAPSLNIYGLKTALVDPRLVPFRPAGGHMHFGGKYTEKEIELAVKGLDATLGVASVSMFRNLDDERRRRLYGLPGEHRLPAHGLEYRTLSNAMLTHPGIYQLCWDIGRMGARFGMAGFLDMIDASENEVVDIIWGTEVKRAQAYVERNKKVFEGLAKLCHWPNRAENAISKALKVFTGGIEEVVKNPLEWEKNWGPTCGGGFEDQNWNSKVRWSGLAVSNG